MKTASTNCPWAYIREGLLSEGYLRQRFGGLIFGRTYFGGGGGGGGGGAYYRNFTILQQQPVFLWPNAKKTFPNIFNNTMNVFADEKTESEMKLILARAG